MKNYFSVILLFALLLGAYACQKEKLEEISEPLELSDTEKRFLNLNSLKSGALTLEQKFISTITSNLETQNQKEKFIEDFVNQYGYPDWEMVRWFEGNGEEVAQIPVLHDNDCETRAVILCVEHNNKLTYHLFTRNNIENYIAPTASAPKKEKIKDLFIIFDFQKFGESSLLPNGSVYSIGEDRNLKSACTMVEITTCYNIDVYSNGDLLSSRTECETEYKFVFVAIDPYLHNEGGSGYSGSTGSGSSNEGGTTTPNPSPTPAPIPSPDFPIDNPKEYFKCLDLNSAATLTIYVDQPIANSSQVVSLSGSVGHTFIGITQGNNTSIFGFYPEADKLPGESDAGKLGIDQNTPFDVSISSGITSTQLSGILNYIYNRTTGYSLNDYNCTDFALGIATIAGLNLPDTYTSWGIGGGSNPAALGQNIRSLSLNNGVTRNTSGGTSPANKKTCIE
jgi:hypothetical protein